MPNLYLDFAIDPNFQGVNRLFVLLFENKDDRTVHTKYYLPTVEIDGYNRTGRSRMGKGEGGGCGGGGGVWSVQVPPVFKDT